MYNYRLKSHLSIDTLRGMSYVLFVCNRTAHRLRLARLLPAPA